MNARILGALGVSVATHTLALGGALVLAGGGGLGAAPAILEESAGTTRVQIVEDVPEPGVEAASAGEAGGSALPADRAPATELAPPEAPRPVLEGPLRAVPEPAEGARSPNAGASTVLGVPRGPPPPPRDEPRKHKRAPVIGPPPETAARRRPRGVGREGKPELQEPREARVAAVATPTTPKASLGPGADAAVAAVPTPAPPVRPAPEAAQVPAPTEAPAPAPPAATHSADAEKVADADSTSGDGSGGEAQQGWLRFARSGELGAGTGGAGPAEYIGDRNVSADHATRVATTTERSLGNARGQGEAMPVPDGHLDDPTGQLARGRVREASAAPVSGLGTLAGAAAGAPTPPEASAAGNEAGAGSAVGMRLSVVGELSDADVAAARAPEVALPGPAAKPKVRRRPRPKPVVPQEAPPEEAAVAVLDEPSPAAQPADAPEPVDPAAAPAPPTPEPAEAAAPPAEDGFWGAGGVADAGEGADAADSPEARGGEAIARRVFKKDGAGWTEITTLEDSVALGDVAAAGIRKTEVGVWFTAVDDLVRASWKPPIAEMALGAEGRVIVEFTILRNGRVRDVAMLDTNASLAMQEAALHAVPAGVPSPPRGRAPLRVRFEFRYGTGAHPR